MISGKIEVKLQCEVFNTFRCKLACDSVDLDVNTKSVHHLIIDDVKLPESWNVGIIYGASGSGKTTLAKKLWGQDVFKHVVDDEKSIIDQLPEAYNYDECASILMSIGLTSIPCWVRPVKTLSGGQRARAEATLLMCQDEELTVIDEWTSVVDRTVAKAMSNSIQNHARKKNKKIILLSCHYDIIEWLRPQWLIDCNKGEFILPENDGFFLHRKKSSDLKSGRLIANHGDTLASIII